MIQFFCYFLQNQQGQPLRASTVVPPPQRQVPSQGQPVTVVGNSQDNPDLIANQIRGRPICYSPV